MKKLDYIVSILIMLSWAADYLILIAPSGIKINPFLFYDGGFSYAWYLDLLAMCSKLLILSICMFLIRGKKTHFITSEIMIINIILIIFEIVWFIGWFNNPFHIELIWIKIFTAAFVYFSIISIRHVKRNNSIFHRIGIRRSDRSRMD